MSAENTIYLNDSIQYIQANTKGLNRVKTKTSDDPNKKTDAFGKVRGGSKVSSQSKPNEKNGKVENLDNLFPAEAEIDQIDQESKKQIDELIKMLLTMAELDDPLGQLDENEDVDQDLADMLRKATNGGKDFQPANIDNFIQNLLKNKLMQVRNKDFINYLAANNAAIKASITLAASAR